MVFNKMSKGFIPVINIYFSSENTYKKEDLLQIV